MNVTNLNTKELLVYRALYRAANAGQHCPSNLELSMIAGYAAQNAASVLVGRLEDYGFITVRRGRKARQVTIVASGNSTAPLEEFMRAPALARLDELADMIAEGATMLDAAAALGVSAQRVSQLWANIRKRLGPQAV